MDTFTVGRAPSSFNSSDTNNTLDGITRKLSEKAGMEPEEIQKVISDLLNVLNASANGTSPEMTGPSDKQGGPNLLESFRQSVDALPSAEKKDEVMNLVDQGINMLRATSVQTLDKTESTTTLSFGDSNDNSLQF